MCFVNQYTLEHPIVIVNDNGEFIERTKAVLSMIPEVIVELCDKYNIHEVGLGGLHSYIDYIKIGIEEEQQLQIHIEFIQLPKLKHCMNN